MDLISRQAAIDALTKENLFKHMDTVSDGGQENRAAIRIIKSLPSVELEPSDVAKDIARIIENEIDMRVIAQSERKKGEWLDTETSYADDVRQECRCSVCSRLSPRPLGNYCRWCGADMRGDVNGNI